LALAKCGKNTFCDLRDVADGIAPPDTRLSGSVIDRLTMTLAELNDLSLVDVGRAIASVDIDDVDENVRSRAVWWRFRPTAANAASLSNELRRHLRRDAALFSFARGLDRTWWGRSAFATTHPNLTWSADVMRNAAAWQELLRTVMADGELGYATSSVAVDLRAINQVREKPPRSFVSALRAIVDVAISERGQNFYLYDSWNRDVRDHIRALDAEVIAFHVVDDRWAVRQHDDGSATTTESPREITNLKDWLSRLADLSIDRSRSAFYELAATFE
jgi:hypothetical protein